MPIEKLISNLIARLKNNPAYKWESEYTLRCLIVIIYGRGIQLVRGTVTRMFIKSKGLVFTGRNVVIKHKHLLTAGKNLILEDNVYINALSSEGIELKDNVTIARDCTLICTGVVAQKGKGIKIGHNTGINAGAYLAGQGGIEIGNDVIIGPGVKIFSENHNFSAKEKIIKHQGVNREGVKIKDNCWIGANVTVLDGVTIGGGCVIAAGSVITRSVPENTVAGGIPARVLRKRFDTQSMVTDYGLLTDAGNELKLPIVDNE